MRGKITGAEFHGTARIVPEDDGLARNTIHRKYWLARIPFLWSQQNLKLGYRKLGCISFAARAFRLLRFLLQLAPHCFACF
jgi:hypothetical protein